MSENGLKPPPPPAIATLAAANGLQAGWGFGLGEALGLGDAVCAVTTAAPRARKIALIAPTTVRRNEPAWRAVLVLEM
ncbi:MAG TPA: hypothetical protein VM940_08655 [Chthoniobacterales bacterium]|nr:hypothetical protein [Chthoniobacterales bacterium]